jgi:hypothetical protein
MKESKWGCAAALHAEEEKRGNGGGGSSRDGMWRRQGWEGPTDVCAMRSGGPSPVAARHQRSCAVDGHRGTNRGGGIGVTGQWVIVGPLL